MCHVIVVHDVNRNTTKITLLTANKTKNPNSHLNLIWQTKLGQSLAYQTIPL